MNEELDDPAKVRPEFSDDVSLTEQDTEYAVAHAIPPMETRVRHWHHWRTAGILCAIAGLIMLIAGHYTDTGHAMQIGGFFILAGAVIFTVGTIGGWITRRRPLD